MQVRNIFVTLGFMSLLNTACAPTGITQKTAFIVTGVSGKAALLDRTWDQGCMSGSGGKGSWMHSKRTLTGLELVTTVIDYQNLSETPDCITGRSMTTTSIQTLSNDNIRVPIAWVDIASKAAAPPTGLEGVTHANGASGALTFTAITPETKLQADQLNTQALCKFTDWTPGVAKNLLSCFLNAGKGTIVVDDRTTPWRIYDGISTDPAEYPTLMPNYSPHQGPFDR